MAEPQLARGAWVVSRWEQHPCRMHVNKYQLYRQIRDELAGHYERELKAVSALIEEGLDDLVGAGARVACVKTDSLIANGDANKVFREEINEAARLILERYQRALRKEIDGLGLSVDEPTWQESAKGTYTNAVSHPPTLGNGKGAEPH